MTIFIGSCADDSIGIGTQIVGEQARKMSGDYPYEVLNNNNWIPCYDIVKVSSDIQYIEETEDDTLSFFSPSTY